MTNTSTTIERLKDLEPRTSGQFGVALKYYAEELNNGTEFGFYYMNYHSRLPYASFFSTVASCARREGNALGIDAYDPLSFLAACPDLPIVHSLTTGDPENATSNAVPLDTVKLLVEYPEDIHLMGVSFATTAFDWSFQGEVAYRSNSPLQVDIEDLVFAAFGPTLSRCHDPNLPRILPDAGISLGQTVADVINGLTGGALGLLDPLPAGTGCAGTTSGIGSTGPGSFPVTDLGGGRGVYAPSDYIVDANGTPGAFKDTFDLLIGHAPGSARSFPAFVTPYRGVAAGENPPCEPQYLGSQNRYSNDQNPATRVPNPNFIPYTPANPCYIRGYERFETFQFNLGGTKVLGASDNPIGADQILFVFEIGATWVPDMPALDELQFEAAGTYTHASAGADGSGADRSRMACSYDPVTKAPREVLLVRGRWSALQSASGESGSLPGSVLVGLCADHDSAVRVGIPRHFVPATDHLAAQRQWHRAGARREFHRRPQDTGSAVGDALQVQLCVLSRLHLEYRCRCGQHLPRQGHGARLRENPVLTEKRAADKGRLRPPFACALTG